MSMPLKADGVNGFDLNILLRKKNKRLDEKKAKFDWDREYLLNFFT